MKQFIQTTVMSFAILGTLLVPASAAFASNAWYQDEPVSFNDHPNDCQTVMAANHTTQAGVGTPCWSTSIPQVQSGETVNVMIYYHNTGYQTANDVRVQLVHSGNSVNNTFTGKVIYQGSVVSQDTITVNSATGLVYQDMRFYPNQATSPASQTSSQGIFSSGGYSVGNLAPDTENFKNQGVVIVRFVALQGSNPHNNDNVPSVTTNSVSQLGDDEATLNGTVSTGGNATDVWFKYRKVNTSSFTQTNPTQHGSGSFSKQVTGLSDGDYEYKACAAFQSNDIEECGSFEEFTIGDGNDDDDNDNNVVAPNVFTDPANNIDQDSATLHGELDEDGGDDNLNSWFEWGTSSGNLNRTANSGDVDNDGEEFSKTITGLNDDTTYYFRACAENDEATDCGSIRNFTTDEEDNDDDNNNQVDDTELPDVQTLSPIQVSSNFATVDGFYNANGCSVDTWFEYGTSQSNLNRSTVRAGHGNNSGSMAQGITGLSSNTVYYYRAVAENCEGVRRGSILSLRSQTGTTVVPPTVITTNTNNTNTVFVGGGGSSFIRLMITNNQETVSPGEELVYDVTWENISGRTLRDLVLEVNLPKVLRITDIDDGEIDVKANSVIIEIAELEPREEGDTSIEVTSRGNLADGDPVVARAIIAFENPATQAQENAIAYDSDEFNRNGSGLGAFLFGAGFFPTTLVGWLLLLLVIAAIVLLARRFMRERVVGAVTSATAPVAPTVGLDGEYISYRPMPKQ